MPLKPKAILVYSAALLFSLQAAAQEPQPPQPADAPVAAAAEPAARPASASDAKVLPRLSVRWDCGDCEQNPKVGPLIEQTYEAQATSKGYSVAPAESAEVVIKEYRQRPPAARVMLGIFAGKDKLATRLSFRGKEYVASDYSANAFQGMNSLCESVAKQALAQVLSAIKE